jgi:hypothetical protein
MNDIDRASKRRLVIYWITTALVALGFAMGGIADLGASPEMVAAMTHLGYPIYFLTILGAWKLLGALAIVVPKLPRLKEWAYAGMVFDLTGAAWSHLASGDGAAQLVAPVVLLGLVATSWAMRPRSRTLVAG